jgi:hypothetical protein
MLKYAGELRVGDIWTEHHKKRAAQSYRVMAITPGLVSTTMRVTGECIATGRRRTINFFLVNRVEVRDGPEPDAARTTCV